MGRAGASFRSSPVRHKTENEVGLAQDAIDLADALRIQSFAVVGHDWGARAAYTARRSFSGADYGHCWHNEASEAVAQAVIAHLR
jgi:hypothetical protein